MYTNAFFVALLVALLLAAGHSMPVSLDRRDDGSLGTSDIENGEGPCTKMTIIYARDGKQTGMIRLGNVGHYPGPQFFKAVADLLGSESYVRVKGVNYGERWINAIARNGESQGSLMMYVSLPANFFFSHSVTPTSKTFYFYNRQRDVKNAILKCPESKIIMAGVGMGARYLHHAAWDLKDYMKNVSAAVTFHDPKFKKGIGRPEFFPQSRVLKTADDNYRNDETGRAAEFVVKTAGFVLKTNTEY